MINFNKNFNIFGTCNLSYIMKDLRNLVVLSKSKDKQIQCQTIFTPFAVKVFIIITNPGHSYIEAIVKTNSMSTFIAP